MGLDKPTENAVTVTILTNISSDGTQQLYIPESVGEPTKNNNISVKPTPSSNNSTSTIN